MDDWDSDSREDLLAEPVDDDGRLMLSASSVATFLRCQHQWELAYVYKIRALPTIRQAVGIAAHDAFETNLLTKMVTQVDLPEELVLDAFSDSYDAQVDEMKGSFDPKDPPDRAKDQGIEIVRKQHREVSPEVTPVLVEAPIQFEINGVIWTGTLDLVDGKGRLRDWKTSQRKPSSAANYQLAMTGYALGYREMTGEVETDVQLDFFVRYKKQPPGYFPIPSGGPVPDRAISTFAEITAKTQEAIMSGIFVPNGLQNNACSWCGYAASGACRYYNPR